MAICQRYIHYFSSFSNLRFQTLLFDLLRMKHTYIDVEESSMTEQLDLSFRKVVDSRPLGMKRSMVLPEVWTVLKVLQSKGFEAYLVGGCVRDLLLKKTPKDFDIVTTASLNQIKQQFHRALIVGRRFPICLVKIRNSILEVSSFGTSAKAAHHKIYDSPFQKPINWDSKDLVRWRDSMRRDFTINSLFFDPCGNTIYDYVNGIEDLKGCKVRTVIPAKLSFKEDSARILRGVRIAARLGLMFSKETASAIMEQSSSVKDLSKDRLMMELNFLMAYGASESSLDLLWRFKLLKLLLPVQDAYLKNQAKNAAKSNMLMKLFSSLDKLLAADMPCGSTLWVALLAFHMTLLHHPQDMLVIWTLSFVLYHGNWEKAVEYAREKSKRHVYFAPEIFKTSEVKTDEILLEEVSSLASLTRFSVDVLIGKAPFPDSMFESSGLVFISNKVGRDVSKLFNFSMMMNKSSEELRKNFDINYKFLRQGDLNETRFVLGQVVLDTLNNNILQGEKQEIKTDATALPEKGTQNREEKETIKSEEDARGLSNEPKKNEVTKKLAKNEEKQKSNRILKKKKELPVDIVNKIVGCKTMKNEEISKLSYQQGTVVLKKKKNEHKERNGEIAGQEVTTIKVKDECENKHNSKKSRGKISLNEVRQEKTVVKSKMSSSEDREKTEEVLLQKRKKNIVVEGDQRKGTSPASENEDDFRKKKKRNEDKDGEILQGQVTMFKDNEESNSRKKKTKRSLTKLFQ